MHILSTSDFEEKTLRIYIENEPDTIIQFIDGTHVLYNDTPYHISQLMDNEYFSEIEKYVIAQIKYDADVETREWVYQMYNILLKTNAYYIAHKYKGTVEIENCGYGLSIIFDRAELVKKWLRSLPMSTNVKNRLKRKIKSMTSEEYDNRVMLYNDIFGYRLHLSIDESREAYDKIQEHSRLEYERMKRSDNR